MQVVTLFSEIPALDNPSAFTLGSFDGVHLGHQALLAYLKSKLPPRGILCVFSFSNHPTSHFAPSQSAPLICPLKQKIKLLEYYGTDLLILLPFNAEFAQMRFDAFLKHLQAKLHFSHLALGKGATFGKNREGNEQKVRELSGKLDFTVDYLEKRVQDGTLVSSGKIRTLIAEGAFDKVQAALGRPYSLLENLTQESARYFMKLPGICLPPEGTYPVHVKAGSEIYPTRAHVFPLRQQIQLDLPFAPAVQEVEIIF